MGAAALGASLRRHAGRSCFPRRPRCHDRRQEDVEILVTFPSVGERMRTVIDEDTDVSVPLDKALMITGFDKPFLQKSDFKVYLKSDETKPITGKISSHTTLRPWSPEGIELHVYYEPA